MNKLLAGLTLLGFFSFAQAQKPQTVYINGQPVKAVSVTVGGKAYTQILTSDLIKTGALTQGGNSNVTSIQGCKGQTLFNGVLRVTLVEAGPNPDPNDSYKYKVRFKVSNGTNKPIGNVDGDAGFAYDYIYVASADGQTAKLDTWEDKESPNRDLINGGTMFVTFKLHDPPTFKVSRILWRPDPNEIKKDLPWAKLKNMEFALECPKK